MNYETLIIGGGVPGMVLALELGQAGVNVALIDAEQPCPQLDQITPDGRTIALWSGSLQILERIGINDILASHGTPITGLTIIDDSDFPHGGESVVEQAFTAAELETNQFGRNISITALRSALSAQLKTVKCVNHVTNDTLISYKINGQKVTATLKSGQTLTASLIIGTDGRKSKVREVASIDVKERSYGQTAITCLVEHSKPHDNISVEFHRSGGPFTFVPCDNNTSSVVWVENTDTAENLIKLPKDGFENALNERTRDRWGHVKLVTNPVAWPLMSLRAETLVAERTALAAEAAHVLSPIGAQGLNLSLRDVATLSEKLVEAKNLGLDIGASNILEGYARARKHDFLTRSIGIDLYNQAITKNGPLRAIRRLSLRSLSLLPPLKRWALKQGLAA